MTSKNKKAPTVVIFGRANVGKSTLLNCLTEKRQALVSPIEGTTRDSNIGTVSWRGIDFNLVDTGGILNIKHLLGKKILRQAVKKEDIDIKVQQQARDYLKRADLILFLIDAKTGILPQDKQTALALKRIIPDAKKIIYVVNKVDGQKERKSLPEFYKLGLGEPMALSAATGSGTGDLLDEVVNRLTISNPQLINNKTREKKEEEEEKEKEKAEISAQDEPGSERKNKKSINVCIVGKPNVGKSSLLNSILGEERVIVSPIPHTTREPQDTFLEYKDQPIKLVDTAGINKRGRRGIYKKAEGNLGVKGIAMSLEALTRADIALFVMDINEPLTNEDSKIIEEIINGKKSLIIIANKWDLVEERETKKYTEYIRDNLPFIAWAPIQFTSSRTGEKVKKVMDLVLEIAAQRKLELTDSQLNSFLMRIVKIHRPSKGRGVKHPHIHKFKQTRTDPPQFELRIGSKDDLHSSYVHFIENRLREKFGFLGTPIHIVVKKNKAPHGSHNR